MVASAVAMVKRVLPPSLSKRPAGQNWPLLPRLIVFGRWPSSAASSVSLKPAAESVRSKGEKYCSERFQLPAGSRSDCEVSAPVARTLPPVSYTHLTLPTNREV